MEDISSIILNEIDKENQLVATNFDKINALKERISTTLSGIIYTGNNIVIVANGYRISVEPDETESGKCTVTIKEKEDG